MKTVLNHVVVVALYEVVCKTVALKTNQQKKHELYWYKSQVI